MNFTDYKTGPLTDAASIAKGGERREMDEESDGESRCYKRGCFTVKRIAPSDERDGPTLMAYDVAVDTLCNNRERVSAGADPICHIYLVKMESQTSPTGRILQRQE